MVQCNKSLSPNAQVLWCSVTCYANACYYKPLWHHKSTSSWCPSTASWLNWHLQKAQHRTYWQTLSLWGNNQMAWQIVAQMWHDVKATWRATCPEFGERSIAEQVGSNINITSIFLLHQPVHIFFKFIDDLQNVSLIFMIIQIWRWNQCINLCSRCTYY